MPGMHMDHPANRLSWSIGASRDLGSVGILGDWRPSAQQNMITMSLVKLASSGAHRATIRCEVASPGNVSPPNRQEPEWHCLTRLF